MIISEAYREQHQCSLSSTKNTYLSYSLFIKRYNLLNRKILKTSSREIILVLCHKRNKFLTQIQIKIICLNSRFLENRIILIVLIRLQGTQVHVMIFASRCKLRCKSLQIKMRTNEQIKNLKSLQNQKLKDLITNDKYKRNKVQ